jgi:hypothetical protein
MARIRHTFLSSRTRRHLRSVVLCAAAAAQVALILVGPQPVLAAAPGGTGAGTYDGLVTINTTSDGRNYLTPNNCVTSTSTIADDALVGPMLGPANSLTINYNNLAQGTATFGTATVNATVGPGDHENTTGVFADGMCTPNLTVGSGSLTGSASFPTYACQPAAGCPGAIAAGRMNCTWTGGSFSRAAAGVRGSLGPGSCTITDGGAVTVTYNTANATITTGLLVPRSTGTDNMGNPVLGSIKSAGVTVTLTINLAP